jgi:DNA helicase-2/ATP-dependent DNA helicase PcrA
MKFFCDFHIHSHYSIATSKNLVPESIAGWAYRKGITVVGTGDFTHPGWFEELTEKLEPAEPGLFRLKPGLLDRDSGSGRHTRFVLSAEISSIYKKSERVRKVHNLILVPDFESAAKIQSKLSKIGNIESDGRPILGLDSHDLLEISLSCAPRCLFIPAHIWTPWFSALGSCSGFDSIAECYGDLEQYIDAVETGLSSDPAMNDLCSFLDRYTLISNSDAHSPEKLGREANILDTELSYGSIVNAIRRGEAPEFCGTVEFFPQEGKYHYDGHRKCGVRLDPVQTMKTNGVCPVCGKKVTVGVMNRVLQLADRRMTSRKRTKAPFFSLIPLKEILSEIVGAGPASKKVGRLYDDILKETGSELELLIGLPQGDIDSLRFDLLSEAIRRMRSGEVYIEEGYDGEYGTVRVFRDGEAKRLHAQRSLFSTAENPPAPIRTGAVSFDPLEFFPCSTNHSTTEKETTPKERTLDEQQERAIRHEHGPAIVLAGPGTGKTHVLTERIVRLILEEGIDPECILALTFTNRAASEMTSRVEKPLSGRVSKTPFIGTFHRFGLHILKTHPQKLGRTEGFTIVNEEHKRSILRALGCSVKNQAAVSESISLSKQRCAAVEDELVRKIQEAYESYLRKEDLFDLDDLVYAAVCLLDGDETILSRYVRRYSNVLVDEYQDINCAQYRLVNLLAPSPGGGLFVIGDPDQAIYGFRGASASFSRRFEKDYPSAKIYRLKNSYRCSVPILEGSYDVLRKAENASGDTPIRGTKSDVRIRIVRHRTDGSEAEWVARTIERMMGGLRFFSIDSDISEGNADTGIRSLSDFAVLVRIGRQMETFRKAFFDHSIPYQEATHKPLFGTGPAGAVLDLLRLSMNEKNRFLWDRVKERLAVDDETLRDICTCLRKCKTTAESVKFLASHAGLESLIEREEKEALFTLAAHASSVSELIESITLGTGPDTLTASSEQVSLLTIHAAKGLEFFCVFIPGCEDGLLPYTLYGGKKTESTDRYALLDEERRLLYVGMTRAKRVLFLSHAQKRFLFGREHALQRSPFLDPIENAMIETAKVPAWSPDTKENRQPDLF